MGDVSDLCYVSSIVGLRLISNVISSWRPESAGWRELPYVADSISKVGDPFHSKGGMYHGLVWPNPSSLTNFPGSFANASSFGIQSLQLLMGGGNTGVRC